MQLWCNVTAGCSSHSIAPVGLGAIRLMRCGRNWHSMKGGRPLQEDHQPVGQSHEKVDV